MTFDAYCIGLRLMAVPLGAGVLADEVDDEPNPEPPED